LAEFVDTSRLSGFFRLRMGERRARIAEVGGHDPALLDGLSSEAGLTDEQADRMIENAIGVMGVPLGVCVYMQIDGKDYFAPMAIEEPSVLAAASYGAKLLRVGGGVSTTASPSHMLGQVQVLDVSDPDSATRAVLQARDEIIAAANRGHARLVAAGGGAVDVEVRRLRPTPGDGFPGPMMIVHLVVDVRDAMGANAVNGMCECIAPRVAELTGGRVGLRILSNLTDRRMIVARGRVPLEALAGRGVSDPSILARAISEASSFAERDPYRAATHNKGIMNGVDAVLLALGQDWRAVEAGAHAYAARNGRYTALSKWRVERGFLTGVLEMPIAVGIVGGVARSHPTVQLTRALATIGSAAEVARVAAAVGLAQNLSALRALAAEGIQHGHMRLHARNVAVEAGASGADVDAVAKLLYEKGTVNVDAARGVVRNLSAQRHGGSSFPAHYGHEEGSLVAHFDVLRDSHWPTMKQLVEDVMASTTPPRSRLRELSEYQLSTGGRRVRERPAQQLIPLGCACEVLHNATLVHDDLLDRDTFRRGRPTIWGHWGAAEAVNAGSAMLLCAPVLVQRLETTPAKRDALTRRLIGTALAIIDSQDKELTVAADEVPSVDAFLDTIADKRSSMFALPLAGAVELLGESFSVVATVEAAGRHLGVLFQLVEEVLALRRQPETPDILSNAKRSVTLVHALNELPAADARRLLALVDEELDSSADGAETAALLASSGSVDFIREAATRRRAMIVDLAGAMDRRPLASLLRALSDTLTAPLRTASPSQAPPDGSG
jgi:hydroxymethylglutaryl-CoA reductase